MNSERKQMNIGTERGGCMVRAIWSRNVIMGLRGCVWYVWSKNMLAKGGGVSYVRSGPNTCLRRGVCGAVGTCTAIWGDVLSGVVHY